MALCIALVASCCAYYRGLRHIALIALCLSAMLMHVALLQDCAATDRAETMAYLAASPAGRCRLDNLAAALAARFAAAASAILPSTAVTSSEPLGPSAQTASRPAFALSD
jgi:hypothetical protein